MSPDMKIDDVFILLDYFVEFAKQQGLDIGLVYEEFIEREDYMLAELLEERYDA